MKAIIFQIKENIVESKLNLIFDIAVQLVCFCLFELNNLVLKGLIPLGPDPETQLSILSIATAIIHNHFNDFLGGCAFLAYTNMLLDLVNPQVRLRRLAPCIIYIFFCGLFWEFVAPQIIKPSTTDLVDIVAYVLGGTTYWLAAKLTVNANLSTKVTDKN